MNTPKMSPWGRIQTSDTISRGIVFVSTASHGGVKLNKERNVRIPVRFRLDDGWYEEDQDWAIPALIFKKEFLYHTDCPDKLNTEIEFICKNWHPDFYTEVTGIELTAKESRKLAEKDFWFDNINNFVVSVAWGDCHEKVPKGSVGVKAKRGEEEQHFLILKEEYKKRGSFGFVIDTKRHKTWEINDEKETVSN